MNSIVKKCHVSGKGFFITDKDQAFYQNMGVLLPTLCPEERHARKLAFRNERNLYKRSCSLCQKEIISMFSPEASEKILCYNCFWGDVWDPIQFGQDFDFSRPFFEQFQELRGNVPIAALYNFDYENSEYCNYACHNKDCYMLFGSWFSEKVMYCDTALHSLEVVDSIFCNECKYGCEMIDCENCYELFYSQNCHSCSNSAFLFDCKNCQYCLFCYNLRNKSYQILNKPVSKEEFEKFRASIWGSYKLMQEAYNSYKELIQDKAIHKFMTGDQNENASGNYIYRCKNSYGVFYGIEVEDVSHAIRTTKHQKDSMDIMGVSGGELMYDSINCDFCHRGRFNINGENNSDFDYCWDCYNCEYCFGCTSLKRKKYCILNKQYTREEYEALVPRIIEHMQKTGEWGEFFSISLSPFAYNETIAQDFFPLTGQEAAKRGVKWQQKNVKTNSLRQVELPDRINEISESITSEILTCQSCNGAYRIIPQELAFYKKYSLPLPRKCFNCRHIDRINKRTPYRSFHRDCSKCGAEITTSYSPDRPEKVYCEQCYLAEVY